MLNDYGLDLTTEVTPESYETPPPTVRRDMDTTE